MPDPGYPWLLLFIQTILMLATAAAAAFLGSYLKTKGQNFATKRDFDELQKQLSENTKLVEAIKSEISHRDWVQRERTTFRRNKLEEPPEEDTRV